jgi:hypothetical protein
MRRVSVLGVLACSLVPVQAWAQAPQLVYTPLNPCRIVDTRLSAAGALTPGNPRTFNVVGSTADFPAQGGTSGGCGIPGFIVGPVARAVVFNFVAVAPQGAGNLRAWPSDQAPPNASVLNYAQVAGLNIANGLIVPLRQDSEGNDITVRADVSGTHVVVDVVGYFSAITTADLPVIPISGGGTGSTVQSFVDLSTSQIVGGDKMFAGNLTANGTLETNGALQADGNVTVNGSLDVNGTTTLDNTVTASGSVTTSGTVRTDGPLQVRGGIDIGSPALTPIVSQDANQRVVRGTILGVGGCTVQTGTGFTCVRNSTGNYTITFTTPFASSPVPLITPIFTTLVQSLTAGSGSMTVQLVNPGNVATDAPFAFLAIGAR